MVHNFHSAIGINIVFSLGRLFYFISEGFRLGPIKTLLPEIGFGKIKLALAQRQKSSGQVIQEVRKFGTTYCKDEVREFSIGSQNNEMK